jgi:hypothetical protein
VVAPILWTHTSTDIIPVTTQLTFLPGLVQITQPQFRPIQRTNIAESGQLWVYELSSTIELELPVEFLDLPTGNSSGNMVCSGYNSLYAFLANTVRWSKNPFVLTDVNTNSYIVRYLRGFESLREATGRAQVADRWSGTITLWRLP